LDGVDVVGVDVLGLADGIADGLVVMGLSVGVDVVRELLGLAVVGE
jgi:hypothetical protein